MTRTQKAIAWGGGLVALLYVTRPRGTVTTWETFDLPDGSNLTNYPESIRRAAEAIARAEGFYVPNSIPQRAHNPGNLKVPGWSGGSINGISLFDSDDQGWNALYRQLMLIVNGQSSYYSLDMSIREMGQWWTATVAEQLAWSSNVARELGVSVDTPLWQVLV